MSVIEGLKTLISQYEKQRDTIYLQLVDLNKELEKRKVLLAAFDVVSTDPVLYDQWVQSVQETQRPQ